MSDETFELSRRNALIGLGTVGVASAGAGLGTSAFFSDQEEFSDNRIQAGEFGMTVKQYIKKIDQDGIGPDEEKFLAKSNDTGVWKTNRIKIKDAKPGDTYKFCWKIKVHDNPGYVALAGDFTDLTGSEAENVDAEDLWDIETNDDQTTIGQVADVEVTLKNTASEPVYYYEYDNLLDLLTHIQDWGALLNDPETGPEEDPIKFEPDKKWVLCVKVIIPEEVGNELQGAELTWNKTFYAEQARHNDDVSAFLGRARDAHAAE